MTMICNHTTLSVGLLCLLLATTKARSSDDDPGGPTTVVSALCNTHKLDPNDHFLRFANKMFRDVLPRETPKDPYYVYSFQSQDTFQGAGMLYGVSYCDTDRTQAECAECLRACAKQLFDYCGPAIGATLEMKACYMRYKNYPLT